MSIYISHTCSDKRLSSRIERISDPMPTSLRYIVGRDSRRASDSTVMATHKARLRVRRNWMCADSSLAIHRASSTREYSRGTSCAYRRSENRRSCDHAIVPYRAWPNDAARRSERRRIRSVVKLARHSRTRDRVDPRATSCCRS